MLIGHLSYSGDLITNGNKNWRLFSCNFFKGGGGCRLILSIPSLNVKTKQSLYLHIVKKNVFINCLFFDQFPTVFSGLLGGNLP